MKKVDLIIDLQYGSTGKGLIAGYLAEKNGYDTVINANMPNAGHTYVDANGRQWIHKVLPNGIVSPNLKRVMIGAGSVFCPKRMQMEIENSKDLLNGVRIMIHPMAVPLTAQHKEWESGLVEKIGSTGQGSVGAMIQKMLRDPMDNVVARDCLKGELMGDYLVSVDEWNRALWESESILAEGAQGYSLGISQSFYPYTTSRDCTPARFLSDMGIPLGMLRKVIGTCRTYPIRVAGTSGDHYDDQNEISWADIHQPEELTTVTKKVRRVFTFSMCQMRDSIFACQPDEIFLNFCNYCDNDDEHIIASGLNELCAMWGTGGRVSYLGYGPSQEDVVEWRW